MAWIGDGNNMANSWIDAASSFGFALRLACPEGYDPDPVLLARAQTQTDVKLLRDPAEAADGATVVTTDVWASMGQEAQHADRVKAFQGFIVNEAIMKRAAPGAIFLHCLPAHRGEEVSLDLLEDPRSVAGDEAENRLHAQKALLELLIAPVSRPMSHPLLLNLQGISCGFAGQPVVQDLSLHLNSGDIACLLGPSGCGKTTSLRAIAGFEALQAGEISLNGEVISRKGFTLPPEQRRIGMVFQDYALFPHLSVAQNVAFGIRQHPRREQLTAELLELVKLGELGKRYPHELSGGQQQRVALAGPWHPNRCCCCSMNPSRTWMANCAGA